MNSSNAPLEALGSEKLDREQGVSATGAEESPENAAVAKPAAPPKQGSGPQLLAASALTSLVKPPAPDSDSPPEGQAEEDDFVIPERYTKSGRKRAIPFPLKLMKVITTKEYSEIIAWVQDGKSFMIIKPKAFVNEILPKHFKQAKFSSFTRKLHRWGFQRHLRGPATGAFFHKMFQRDRLDLCEQMTCQKPGAGHSSAAAAAIAQQMAFRQTAGMPGMPFGNQFMPQGPFGGLGMQQPPQQDFLSSADFMAEAQQALRRQQQQQQMMQARHQQEARGLGGGGEAMDPSKTQINAAIEMEVSRRLNERIQAASMSRQALAMMQQQLPPPNAGMGQEGFQQGLQQSFPSFNPSFQGQSPQFERNIVHKGMEALRDSQTFGSPDFPQQSNLPPGARTA